MLILSRRLHERIIVDNNIVIEIVAIKGDVVRLGILAPIEVTVDREEVAEAKRRGKERAR